MTLVIVVHDPDRRVAAAGIAGGGRAGAVWVPRSNRPRRHAAATRSVMAIDGLIRGVRSMDFWLLAVSFGICGFSTNGLIGTHLIAYCVDNGYSQFDRRGHPGIARRVQPDRLDHFRMDDRSVQSAHPAVLDFGLRGLSLLVLPYTNFDTVSLTVFAVFYGLDWIAVMPPIFALVNEVFGKKSTPVIMSWIFATHQIGGAMAAVGAGVVRTWTGSYLLAFMMSGIACLLASILVMRIARSRPAILVAGE